MPNVFFLSYARHKGHGGSGLDVLDRFERELSEQIKTRLQDTGGRVGFRDVCHIEAGTPEWSAELARKLVDYPVGIVLLSPAYLSSQHPWCKWEFSYLETRNAAADTSANRNNPAPRLLLMLDWIRPDSSDIPGNFPSTIQKVGESIASGISDDAEDIRALRVVFDRGVKQIIELVISGDDESCKAYTRFLQVFGQYIVEQWRRWEALEHKPPVRPREFDMNDQWLPRQPISASKPAEPRPDRIQRRKIFVVYVAARPQEVPPTREWRYREDGEYDWRPFAKSLESSAEPHVGEILRALDEVDVKEWPFDYFRDHMKQALQMAERRYPVVFIVDPWTTAQLERYRAVLAQYVEAEQSGEFFSSPVVIWNEEDADALAIRGDFEKKVAALFSPNRWEPVGERENLKDALLAIISGLQRKIRHAMTQQLATTGLNRPLIRATT